MPTPGWRFEVDSIELDEKAQQIVARVTEIRPTGMLAQVITTTHLVLPLGSIRPGRYVLVVWVRRDTGKPYRLAEALILAAS